MTAASHERLAAGERVPRARVMFPASSFRARSHRPPRSDTLGNR